jgi:hypothetical protein
MTMNGLKEKVGLERSRYSYFIGCHIDITKRILGAFRGKFSRLEDIVIEGNKQMTG